MSRGNPHPRTDHLKPFQYKPGQSGQNAYTKVNSRLGIKYRLQKMADEIIEHEGHKMSKEDHICRILYDMCIKDRNLDAIKYRDDRIYGKLTDKVKVEGEAGVQIIVRHVHGYGQFVEEPPDPPALEGPNRGD